jgi:Ca2+-binding EF-hand superfamily protein
MKITQTEMNQMIRKAFDLYDADKSGVLDKMEIRTLLNDLMAELGAPSITDATLDKIIEMVDENNDGAFDFKEFYKIISPVLTSALA